MFDNLSVRRKILLIFGLVCVAMAIAFGVVFWAISRMADEGLRVGERLVPLGDAAMEIKLTATSASHLLEEIMSGESTEEFSAVDALFDETEFFADAILNGGENGSWSLDEALESFAGAAAALRRAATIRPDAANAVTELAGGAEQLIALARERHERTIRQSTLRVETRHAFSETFRRFVASAEGAGELVNASIGAGISSGASRAMETAADP